MFPDLGVPDLPSPRLCIQDNIIEKCSDCAKCHQVDHPPKVEKHKNWTFYNGKSTLQNLLPMKKKDHKTQKAWEPIRNTPQQNNKSQKQFILLYICLGTLDDIEKKKLSYIYILKHIVKYSSEISICSKRKKKKKQTTFQIIKTLFL